MTDPLRATALNRIKHQLAADHHPSDTVVVSKGDLAALVAEVERLQERHGQCEADSEFAAHQHGGAAMDLAAMCQRAEQAEADAQQAIRSRDHYDEERRKSYQE